MFAVRNATSYQKRDKRLYRGNDVLYIFILPNQWFLVVFSSIALDSRRSVDMGSTTGAYISSLPMHQLTQYTAVPDPTCWVAVSQALDPSCFPGWNGQPEDMTESQPGLFSHQNTPLKSASWLPRAPRGVCSLNPREEPWLGGLGPSGRVEFGLGVQSVYIPGKFLSYGTFEEPTPCRSWSIDTVG